ncbi:pseudouridylate synthase [Propionibacterium acidifaciens F0233]|uniref:Pseudouridine synthase n=1 Tax=Propionibacterium acidifaciens F0233 TaxID=553198 RepID=U2PY41_9ACTN|nr:pseudouridine synthase [Propionibacterium acidifaciens]AYW76976.1 rRNA pseudouridine synthase [Propionibacterium acidifaciens]ERK49001.1 pseudouridylate synthase [Propionibacterium acidifaciens F0233]
MSRTSDREETEGIRLQKALSQAGVASRRAAEAMIEEGRVEVNGRVVTTQGLRVDPGRDTIRVDGARIPAPRRHTYLLLNKPRGVVATMDAPEGRETLAQYVPRHQRLYHVGRLDTDTEGLIILTNDGEFAHRLAHPSYEVRKTYLVDAEGLIDDRVLHRLEKGLRLEDGPIRPDRVRLVSRGPSRTLVRITLHSGRNRIVRRMMDSVGHPVRRLARIGIGPVRLGDLASGGTRELTREELGTLLDLVGM